MFADIIETDHGFNERLVFRLDTTEEEAQAIAREYYDKHSVRLVRVYWRQVVSVLNANFYETEQQVIVHGITNLLNQKVYLNGFNLAAQVKRLLVEEMEQGAIPWADPDLLGSAITKLDNLHPDKRQQILREYKQ